MADDGTGDLEAGVGAGDINNFDSTHPVQTEFSPSHVQHLTAQSSSFDTSLPNTLSSMPAVSYPVSHSPQPDTSVFDRQSLSRSMSRASSESTESAKINTKSEETNEKPSNHTEEGGDIDQSVMSTTQNAENMENISSLDLISEQSLKVSTNAVSPDSVPMKINVQDQISSDAAQNGENNHDTNSVATASNPAQSLPNGHTASPPETSPASGATDSKPVSKSVPSTPITPAPRSRLPNDVIGILEDRIKEDPRGDIEAWLNLVNEHKKRAKIDDVRSVYERFLAIFPAAV